MWEAYSRNGTLAFSLPLLQSEGKQLLRSLSDEASTENLPMAPNIFSEPVVFFLLQLGLKNRDHVAAQSAVDWAGPTFVSKERWGQVWESSAQGGLGIADQLRQCLSGVRRPCLMT